MIDWPSALLRGASSLCEQEFGGVLISNLRPMPIFTPSSTKHEFYVEVDDVPNTVWKFMLPAHHLSTRWLPFLDLQSPEGTFRVQGGELQKSAEGHPAGQMQLRRIITRAPHLSHKLYPFGTWEPCNKIFTQYIWKDGQVFLNASTPHLRLV